MDEAGESLAKRAERIYLVGFMGAGKTVVGEEMAERLGYRFVDLDREIEARAGQEIPEIFARRGEKAFRELEHDALRQVADGPPRVVVATGGGTFTSERNRALAAGSGVSVWLRPSFETLIARLEAGAPGARPLFRDRESARELYRRRQAAYGAAHLRIEVGSEEPVGQVADKVIASIFGGKTCAT